MSLYILSFLYIVMARSGSSTVMYNLKDRLVFHQMDLKNDLSYRFIGNTSKIFYLSASLYFP